MHHCLQINKLRNFPDLKLIGNVFPLQRTLDMGFINLNLQSPSKGELLRTRKIGLTWICSVYQPQSQSSILSYEIHRI